MNTDIRFLVQLETDLAEAAAREVAVARSEAPGAGGIGGSRRLPRRERHWGGIAAGLVAFLVLAGSIGFLSQHTTQDASTASGDAARRAVGERDPFAGPAAQASTAPMPNSDTAFGGVDSAGGGTRGAALTEGGTQYNVGDQAAPAAQPALSAGLPADQAQSDLSKIVRDGNISIVVPDGTFETSLTKVSRVATSLGGFVLTSSTRDQNTGTFTLRIPAKKFDTAMDRLRDLGEVKADQVTGDDVTAEFIDQQARLQILIDRRDLLQNLQNDATTSSEILRLAGLIEQTQLEIEKTQGELRFIKDQVAEATIKVELREQHAPEEEPPSTTDRPRVGDAIELGWEGFLRVVGAVIVGLGYLIPVAVIGLAIWGIVTLVRRRRRATS